MTNNSWFTLSLTLLGVRVLVSSSATDGPQPAHCTINAFNWTFNEQGKSPCDVSQELYSICFPNDIYPTQLNSSDPEDGYIGVAAGFTNKCECNSVDYSLLQACALCQGFTSDTWKDYTSNCNASDVFVGSFPLPFPNDTSIPAWAFLDVTENNEFLISKAMEIAGTLPDLTEEPPSASSTKATTSVATYPLFTTSGSTSPSIPLQASETRAPANSDSSKNQTSSNIGAIVGGTLGGLAFVIAGVTVLIVLSRRRRRTESRHETFPISSFPQATRPEPSLKLYDPSDPSTFPASIYLPAVMRSVYSRGDPISTVSSSPSSNGYRGVAQL